MRVQWMFGIAGLLILDRLFKLLALRGIEWQMPGFRFVLFKNENLVFSLPSGDQLALIVMLMGCVALVWLLGRSLQKEKTLFIPAALMLGGALGNLYDRLAYGFVVDWAYLGRWWPVFNLADVMIMVGLVWYLWQRERLTARK